MNLKKISLIIFSIFYLGSLQANAAASSMPTFNQAAFDANAALYGNKTANLIELNKIVNVPPFFGIASPEIIARLKEMPHGAGNTWEYILTQWDQFRSAQSQDATHLTDDARTALANIRKAIEHTYFDVNVIAKDRDRLDNLKTFLQTAIDQNKLLMVRSTGREDGKELSNAGGNTSVASVSPANGEQLSKAIQEVLSSYVSEKSIGQRLLGKDPHLFDEPFMAVLLQVMTGEVFGIDTEIPKSGVMFSPEAEGETPGVVVIQATFGHNEGVVNGLVPVDTYYVGPTNIIHPVISIKRNRLAAKAGEPGLHFIDNQETLQRASTLNAQTVLALKNAAEVIQNYYGNAVDIEFVILNNIVYFVQARPLEAKKFQASYLKPEFIAQNNNTSIPVIPIGVGNAAVRIIINKDQLIIADNIRQALDTFLFKTADQDAIQAVIINESAPATSHEATQFRRLGKPVLCAQDFNAIRSALQQLDNNIPVSALLPQQPVASSSAAAPPYSDNLPVVNNTHSLLIDPQRAVITSFIPNDTFSSAESTVKQGWYAHPIAKKVSLIGEFLILSSKESLEGFELKEFFTGVPTTKLIDIIKESNPEIAHQALQSFVHRIFSALQDAIHTQQQLNDKALATNNRLIIQLKHVAMQIISSAHEINATLNDLNASELERLYPITFLEALISQIPEPNRLVNDYSFGSLLKTEKQEQSLATILNLQSLPWRSYIVQYAKAGASALLPETEEHWNAYIRALAGMQDPGLQNRFAQLMLTLSQVNVLPLWLNTSFEQAYEQHKEDPFAITSELLAEYDTSADFIAELQQLNNALISFNPSAFEDPAAFDKQFLTLIRFRIKTIHLFENLDTASNLGKMIALQVMHNIISTFDTSIKALTGSNLYADQTLKIERFRTLLGSYLGLLQTWILIIPSIAQELEQMLDSNTFRTVQAYIEKIDMFPTDNSPKQLLNSQGFNVAGAALGSKANWHRSAPNPLTLEDIFTLIHQNLLVVEGVFAKTTNLQALKIPERVALLKNNANNLQLLGNRANLIGVSFDNNRLTYYYNLPQRNHSSTFQIIYDLKTRGTSLAVQFLGQARNRWALIAGGLYLLEDVAGLALATPVEIDNERGALSFVWKINTPEQAIKALQYLEAFGKYATNTVGQNLLDIIAMHNNIDDEKLTQRLLEKIPQQPLLTLFTPDIAKLLGKKHPYTKNAYQQLMNLFCKASAFVQQNALPLLLSESHNPTSAIRTEDLLPLLSKCLHPEIIDQNLMIALEQYLFIKISLAEVISFIKTKFLDSKILSVQVIGIRLLTLFINDFTLFNPGVPAPFSDQMFAAFVDEIYAQYRDNQSIDVQYALTQFLSSIFKHASRWINTHRETVSTFLSKEIISPDYRQQIAAANLLADLVSSQQLDSAMFHLIEPLIETLKYDSDDNQIAALRLLLKLVKNGFFIEEIPQAAKSMPENIHGSLFIDLLKAIISANNSITTQRADLLAELIIEKIPYPGHFERIFDELLKEEKTIPIALTVIKKIDTLPADAPQINTITKYNPLAHISLIEQTIPYADRDDLMHIKSILEKAAINKIGHERRMLNQTIAEVDKKLS